MTRAVGEAIEGEDVDDVYMQLISIGQARPGVRRKRRLLKSPSAGMSIVEEVIEWMVTDKSAPQDMSM